jgi:Uma2 family endonuclease
LCAIPARIDSERTRIERAILAAGGTSWDTAGVALAARSITHSFRDYVALEEYSNVRHEFREGLILAMAGGSPEHAALAAAVSGIILQGITGSRCAVHSSDLRVRILATGLVTYPDASVVCAPRELDPEDRNTVLNPRVLIEVTSPSSEEYDRGEKRDQYHQIASLQEYVVVSHRERHVEIWRRQGSGWTMETAGAGQRARLDSIGLVLEVDRIYDLATQAG